MLTPMASSTITESTPPSPLSYQLNDPRPQFLGHPAGLFLLFMVEMWERFSYYGMRALLVLYLSSPITGMRKSPSGAPEGFNPGLGWTDGAANTLYGWYTGLAYLFPVVGGIIADRLIGTHRSMLIGGLLIISGHIALAASGTGSLHAQPMGTSIFMFGLALIVLGTGHFKPSVSVMVGQLYAKGDPRRDGGFSIFYMGINLGAFLCAFVCGTLGERVGWHWGFGAAAVGMFLGLTMYSIGRPMLLKGIGEPGAGDDPFAAEKSHVSGGGGGGGGAVRAFTLLFILSGFLLSAAFAVLFHIGALDGFQSFMSPTVAGVLAVLVFIAATMFVVAQRPEDRGPTASIFIFMVFNAFFWFAFEQAGSSMTIFTDRYTDTSIAGPGSWQMPTSWFQSVNALFIILLAPIFTIFWQALARRNMVVPQPVKIALGLIFLGLGFVVLVFGARMIRIGTPTDPTAAAVKASLFFIIATYFLHTVGELFLSPTGLSYVTKAAPVKFVTLLMGIWFISSFIANLAGGLVAASVKDIEDGKITLPWSVGAGTGSVQADFFTLFVVTSIGAGLLILILTPLLRKLMRDRNH